MVDYTHLAWGASWSYQVNTNITLLTHRKLIWKIGVDICYLQLDQLSVIIEDSRWQLLYLVVIQGPKKRYSMSLAKIILPLVCCCCWVPFWSEYSLFVPWPGQTDAFKVTLNVIEQIDIYIYIYINIMKGKRDATTFPVKFYSSGV